MKLPSKTAKATWRAAALAVPGGVMGTRFRHHWIAEMRSKPCGWNTCRKERWQKIQTSQGKTHIWLQYWTKRAWHINEKKCPNDIKIKWYQNLRYTMTFNWRKCTVFSLNMGWTGGYMRCGDAKEMMTLWFTVSVPTMLDCGCLDCGCWCMISQRFSKGSAYHIIIDYQHDN